MIVSISQVGSHALLLFTPGTTLLLLLQLSKVMSWLMEDQPPLTDWRCLGLFLERHHERAPLPLRTSDFYVFGHIFQYFLFEGGLIGDPFDILKINLPFMLTTLKHRVFSLLKMGLWLVSNCSVLSAFLPVFLLSSRVPSCHTGRCNPRLCQLLKSNKNCGRSIFCRALAACGQGSLAIWRVWIVTGSTGKEIVLSYLVFVASRDTEIGIQQHKTFS